MLPAAVGKCVAFPNGIPKDILPNGGDHRLPWEGDNGVQYEPREGYGHLLELWVRLNSPREVR